MCKPTKHQLLDQENRIANSKKPQAYHVDNPYDVHGGGGRLSSSAPSCKILGVHLHFMSEKHHNKKKQ